MPTNKDSPRSRGSGAGVRKLAPEKSASFHGRLPTEHRTLRRPKTQPDLLADSGRRTPGKETPPWETGAASGGSPAQRVPTKVLVNVTVQRSLGAVQVVASTDWTVGELVAAVLQQYMKEGRRPPLPSSDPSAYALHYSQFSLECLEAEERLIGLGSRNFFLCPKPAASSSGSAPPAREKACSKEAAKSEMKASSKGGGSGVVLPWLRFMDFLL
ncbi:hypothetical protein Taro_040302 [Colocasia esculenta]|uniref:DUF7054 domain-containing protein n=1 Tax=Colocasia esculenta TaxID=4460 RepID=A0A843W8M5_COLES|nr:hypothetical protein [Colocasia esculenta]